MAACQVAVGSWLSLTLKNCVPSRYQVTDSAAVLVRFTITVYVWYPVWQPEHACSPLPMPVPSSQGPPG